MLKLKGKPATHEELFVQRYGWLLTRALQFAEGDRHKAENLVHDTYVQFVLARPEVSSIQSIEAYLYTALKNTHLSYVRRQSNDPERNISLIDYDSAEIGLRHATNPQLLVMEQDKLRQICQYVCCRKETSKAGSVLILRFFFGYYPSEIVRLLKVSSAVVKKLLQIARAEARNFIDSPKNLSFIGKQKIAVVKLRFGYLSNDIFNDLQSAIFSSRTGVCLSKSAMIELYESEEVVKCERLAHIICCQKCLERVNEILDIPSLKDRYPPDTTGNDTSGRDHGGEIPPADDKSIRQMMRRVRETLEHSPQELRIYCNGNNVSSQRINAAETELSLKIKTDEPINFVEVFSEQGLRLILLNIALTPSREEKRNCAIYLQEGRQLQLTAHPSDSGLILSVIYLDPSFDPAENFQPDEFSAQNLRDESRRLSSYAVKEIREKSIFKPHPLTRIAGWLPRFRQITDFRIGMRPIALSALCILLMIAILIVFNLTTSSLQASQLLDRAAAAEISKLSNPQTAVHRTIELEERQNENGAMLSRTKIEVWHSAAKAITVRRLYSESGNLLAGEWRDKSGKRTFYHRQAGSRQLNQLQRDELTTTFSEAWQTEVSAEDFKRLVGSPENAQVVPENGQFKIISVNKALRESEDGILKATLVLRQNDLQAMEQTLLLRRNNEVKEFRWVETKYEHIAIDRLNPSIFEPETELLSNSVNPAAPVSAAKSQLPSEASEIAVQQLVPVSKEVTATASTELEVETLKLLSDGKADLGEQVSVSQMPSGKLSISGVLESKHRRDELMQILAPVIGNPAVRIELLTIDEATAQQRRKERQTKGGKQQSLPKDPAATEIPSPSSVGGTNEVLPVDTEVRRMFVSRGVSSRDLDEAVRHYANRITTQSRQVMRHAYALKILSERFTLTQLRKSDYEAQRQWLSLINKHVGAIKRENFQLGQQLSEVFPSSVKLSATGEAGKSNLDVNFEIVKITGKEIFAECAANDERIRGAFTVATKTSPNFEPNQLWHSLSKIEQLVKSMP